MIWLLAIGFGALTIYEIWSAISHEQLTISQWVWKLTARSPAIPFALGFLMGHFFG